ncbi:homoserine dehydrogenase [Dehalobacterium formicoaceticum]|uniref:Homoserine dehydrogenase n=1 Tax=Dehalobacterium formicoaceticum TaxID=51515 RepID=A0ABT1Y5Q8_9FIRM|nr:homoserine dehydrogenase [Dehalobacterium formicoaceticum]MCR6545888.1 homoserine dehydrogenase [Dehalobacterium formicoaceticum]
MEKELEMDKELDQVIYIGLMGAGTVGTGVLKVLLKNETSIAKKVGARLEVKRILDKDVEGISAKVAALGMDGSIVTSDINDLVLDPEIDIIVEVMGGIQTAEKFIIKALENGKSVVTANKDLIAARGKELFDVAAAHQVDLLFEASVAGGVPIIQSLKESLAGNVIHSIMGIVNGTTNFILTKMTQEKKSFDEVLALAQKLGYAEADPASDVEGYDAARKVAILASIAFNTRVTDTNVYVEGITNITDRDIAFAQELGYGIKLLGIAKEENNEIEVRVHPAMIPLNHPLSSVNDAFNAVFVEGDAIGKTMFYGAGAGELPTASAIVGDLIAAARNIQFSSRGRLGCTCFEHKRIKSIGEIRTKYFLRMLVKDQPGVLASIAAVLGNQDVSIETVIQKRQKDKFSTELVLITHQVEEHHIRDAIAIIRSLSSVEKMENIIRVEESD